MNRIKETLEHIIFLLIMFGLFFSLKYADQINQLILSLK